MSCSGRPPTNPPEPPAGPAPAAAAEDASPRALNALAEFVGGRWIVPPPVTHTDAQALRCAEDAGQARTAIRNGATVALPGTALTGDLKAAALASQVGLLVHDRRTPVLRAVASGWAGAARPVILPGQLVDVHGRGLLLTGPAGSGKSEATLGLVERGHRLVADDAFRAGFQPRPGWQGRPCAGAEGRLAVRGLGILDMSALFGAGALATGTRIHLEVTLDPTLRLSPTGLLTGEWDRSMLPGIPRLRLPTRDPRNLPLLLEIAVRQSALR
ncbi:hypothetical protein H0Z60_03300 [Ectothiorhodospiraceae bacterium WFHF3C12]|nr:hypothetical protein [Ectothiorhodospiraceae bacterium WFHF3C12]